MDDLNTLFPNTTIKLSTGEEVEVKPFTFGQLPKAIALGKDLFGIARAMYEAEGDSAQPAALVGELFATGGESFIQMISMSISKPRSWFDTLPADDGLAIATTFLEVNLSFFAQKVLPEFKKGMGRLQKAVPGLTQ